MPGSSSEVLITSADSRIRVVDGSDLIHKFKGNPSYSYDINIQYGVGCIWDGVTIDDSDFGYEVGELKMPLHIHAYPN